MGRPQLSSSNEKKPFLKTLIGIGKNKKLDYIKLFKLMHGYYCVVTPKKKIGTFVLFSLRVSPDWNFEIMTNSTNQVVFNSAFMP